jgi:hypothetical protein
MHRRRVLAMEMLATKYQSSWGLPDPAIWRCCGYIRIVSAGWFLLGSESLIHKLLIP